MYQEWIVQRIRATAIAAMLLLGCCSSTQSQAQSLADRMPAGTLVFAEVVGTKNVSSFPASNAGQLANTAEMRKFLATVWPTIKKLAEKEGDADAIGGLKLLEQLLPALLADGGAFYIASFDATGPRAGLVLKAPNKGKALFDQNAELFLRAVERDNVSLRQVGDYLVMGFGYGADDEVLPAEALPMEKSLAGSARYKAATAATRLEPLVRVFVDIEGVHRSISSLADIPEAVQLQDYPQIAEVTGLNTLDSLSVSSGVGGKNWRTELHLLAKQPRGLAAMLIAPGARVDTSVLKAIPADASLALTLHFDAAVTLESIRGMVQAHAPQFTEQLDAYLGLVSQALGTDIPKEVLPHLGSTWAAYRSSQVAGDGLFGTVVVNKLRDPAKAAAGVDKLGQGINRSLMSVSKAPAPIFSFRSTAVDGISMRTLAGVVANPSVAVQGEYLIIGMQPQAVAAAAKFLAGGISSASLADSASYKAEIARLGAPADSATSYFNLPAFAPTGYQTLVFLANAVAAGTSIGGGDTPVAILPPYYKVKGMFSPAITGSWSDENGFHVVSETPFPLAEIVSAELSQVGIGQAAMATSILLPSLNRARETANRVKCASNLRQIGQGLLLHSNENRGFYPRSLGELVKTQDMGAEVFFCPSGSNPILPHSNELDDLITWADETCHYEFLAAELASDEIGPEVIIVIEREGAHGGDGRNALFGDGHVEFLREQEIAAVLDQSREALGKVRRKQ